MAEKATRLGGYAVFDAIAAGGMATVHLARLTGPEGFSRVVAVKRLHPHLLQDADFRRMFLDEARLAARVRHPNVVPILDVLAKQGEVMLVMEYVHGESLLALERAAAERHENVPLGVACAIMISLLQGLHAAHEARSEKGEPLGIVHRDVSPHNVLVGADGVARVLDFGVAKAMQARHETEPGMLKGKYSYMAPEVLRGVRLNRQADVFSAATVFWELITGRRLFGGVTEQERILQVLQGDYPAPSMVVPTVPSVIERIVMRGLHPDVAFRYPTALEMAVEIERSLPSASQRVVGEWVSRLGAAALAQRSELLQQIEISQINTFPPPPSTEGEMGRVSANYERVTLSDCQGARSSLLGSQGARSSLLGSRKLRVGLVLGSAALALVGVAFALGMRSHPAPMPAASQTGEPTLPLRASAAPSYAVAIAQAPPSGVTAGSDGPRPLGARPKTARTAKPVGPAPKRVPGNSHGKTYLPKNL